MKLTDDGSAKDFRLTQSVSVCSIQLPIQCWEHILAYCSVDSFYTQFLYLPWTEFAWMESKRFGFAICIQHYYTLLYFSSLYCH
jgi:hypothetical protein